MKTFDPQAMYSEWMSQLGSQASWQELGPARKGYG
jgi:hypothetical protein